MIVWRLKQLISKVAGRVIDLDGIVRRRRGRYVLSYHRVLPPDYVRKKYVQDVMWITPETLDAQIGWMQSVGRVVDLPELLDFGQPNDTPLFALTFDDGWRDNYDHAFPVLTRRQVTATVFLVTSAVDSGELFWVETLLEKSDAAAQDGKVAAVRAAVATRLGGHHGTGDLHRLLDRYVEQLKEVPREMREQRIGDYYRELGLDPEPIRGQLLNWEQVAEMAAGGVRFGSHSHTHEILKYLDDKTVTEELATSRNILSKRLGHPVEMFCYPNARYLVRHRSLLKEAGYRYGFRIDNLPVTKNFDPYLVPRKLVNEQVSANAAFLKFRLLGVPGY